MRMPRRVMLWSALPLIGMVLGWHALKDGELIAGPRSGSNYTLTTQETALLQDGDIILRRGSGMVSDMIAAMLAEPYDISHCGVVVERDGELWVVHSVSNNVSDADGMQAHRLPAFVRQSKPGSVIITRLHAVEDRSTISRKARHYLRQRVPFDHNFDREDSTHLYCSELIWRILRDDHGLDILEGTAEDRLSAFRFAHLMDPRWFDVVLNHQE
jgi:uncharacterized protein YycO